MNAEYGKACDCGFHAGDEVIVTGDVKSFGHPLVNARGTLVQANTWNQGEGWVVMTDKGTWDVSCEDLALITSLEEEVESAIASILGSA